MIFRDSSHLFISQATAVTLGTFDGLHRGHQALLDRVKEKAQQEGLKSLVLTFPQPPQNYINGRPKKKLILPLKKKVELLQGYGIDDIVVVDFPDVCEMSPSEFARQLLKQRLKAAHVVVGYDCRFGKRRAGDTETLRALGSGLGFGVTIVDPIMVDGMVASSTEVRKALHNGEVAKAARLLGHCSLIWGRVVKSEKGATEPGFPTASLVVDENIVTPQEGVFMISASCPEREEPGLMAIGPAPSPQDKSKILRVRLHNARLDQRDGEELEVKLVKRLRTKRIPLPAHPLRELMATDIEPIGVVASSRDGHGQCLHHST